MIDACANPIYTRTSFRYSPPNIHMSRSFFEKNTRQMHRSQSRWAVLSIAPSEPRVLSPYLS
jgi:hypothetical protein